MKDIYCILGFYILLISIFMLFPYGKGNKTMSLYNILNKEQKKKHMELLRDNTIIFNISTIIAFITATLYYSKNMAANYSVCKSISIFSLLQIGIFHITNNKSSFNNSFNNSLTTKEQHEAWKDIKQETENKWIKSYIFGNLGYFIIFYSTK